jgi:hypothetical protein
VRVHTESAAEDRGNLIKEHSFGQAVRDVSTPLDMTNALRFDFAFEHFQCFLDERIVFEIARRG